MDLPRPESLAHCAPAPNPRRVRVFLAKKGVALPVEQVDMMSGAQFRDHAARVGSHHVPAVRLAGGRRLTESVAIRRYVEALWPEFNLTDRDPLEAGDRDVEPAGGADITALVTVDFLRPTRIAVPERCAALLAWWRGLDAWSSLRA